MQHFIPNMFDMNMYKYVIVNIVDFQGSTLVKGTETGNLYCDIYGALNMWCNLLCEQKAGIEVEQT
jgi:hypothetical protein